MKNKQKTRKSAAKRFKVSGTGKITHRAQGARHLKSGKTSKRLRHLKQPREVLGIFKKKVKRMLGK